MKPELGSIDLVGKSGTECVLANKNGLGLLSVRQDGWADPLWVVFMVTLLGLCRHAGVERGKTLGIKYI